MKLSDSKMGKAAVVEVSGRMDATSSSVFEAHCNKLVAKGDTVIVLDFGDLEYLSSAGLRSILGILKKVKPLGGNVVISGAKGTAKEIFDISGFSSMFTMTDTMEDAASKVM
jgi:anti-sigma B factor antagonist